VGRRLRDPNARLQSLTFPQDKATSAMLVQIRESLVDIWAVVSPAPITASGDYEVTGKVAVETVICTNTSASTITLPAQPDDLAEVVVKATNSTVTVTGNGKTIDGSATKILTAYDGMHIVYTDAAGEWSII